MSSALPRTPFDIAALEHQVGWRDSLRWPVAPSEERAASLGIAGRLLEFMREMGGHDWRDAVVAAGPVVLNASATLARAALAVERAQQSGIVLAGGPPEISFLVDGTGHDRIETPISRHTPVRSRWPAMRHFARTASWTPAWRLPRAFLRPDATAVTHNALLRTYAHGGRLAVRFRQAERVLDTAGALSDFEVGHDATDLATGVVDAVLSCLDLEEPRRYWLDLLLRRRVAASIASARAELCAVSRSRGLPREIWLGTAGRMPARIVAVAARRRGARVTSFDHGGGLFLSQLHAGTVMRELAVVDRIVVATETVAELGRRALPDRSPAVTREVLPADGDPTFRRVRPAKPGRRNIRRVLYLPSTLRGFRTLIPPLLPDVVALDWQMRLAHMLSRLPIELAIRPHPESLLSGTRHPATREFTPLVDQPFHRTIDVVDAFVFEYPNSTAFWEALCTDRPTVWIDLGTGNLSREARAVVARRCRIVGAHFDDRNRPQIDESVLADAVCGGPVTADPTEMRRLLAGDVS